MQERDYKNYDYIDVLVKKQNQQEIIDAYSSFLWENIGNKEDTRYNDVVNLSFKRDIKVLNKDRLAFLQVCYESALNKKAEIKSKKHSKSIALICNLAFFSLAGLFLVGVFIYFFKSLLSIILASIVGLFIFALDIIAVKKIKKRIYKENSNNGI